MSTTPAPGAASAQSANVATVLPGAYNEANWICGNGGAISGRMAAAADGEVIRAEVVPAVIRSDFRGAVTVLFEVLGDHSALTITQGSVSKSVSRTTSGSIGGRVYSRFDTTFDLDPGASLVRGGRDAGDMIAFTASLNGRTLLNPARVYVAARYIATAVPTRRIADHVQYSAHVVNIATRDELDHAASGSPGNDFAVDTLKNTFFAHFADAYDAVVLLRTYNNHDTWAGVYHSVRSINAGIGNTVPSEAPLGITDRYGSKVLQGIIRVKSVYASTFLHELAHRWGDYWRWNQIASVTTLDGSHPPLWGHFETTLSYRLADDQYLEPSGDVWAVRTDPEPTFSPLELYAMGRIAARDVPAMEVLLEQNQQPGVGGRASGGSKAVSIDDIIRVHGARTGPAVDSWRAAIVVLSPERLLSPAELAFFDYFGQRMSDPGGQELLDQTFQKATGAPLDTTIRTLEGDPIESVPFHTPVYSGPDAGTPLLLDSSIPASLRRERLDIRGSFQSDWLARNRPIGIRVQITNAQNAVVLTTPTATINSSGAFMISPDLGSVPPGRGYRLAFQAEFQQPAGFFGVVGSIARLSIR